MIYDVFQCSRRIGPTCFGTRGTDCRERGPTSRSDPPLNPRDTVDGPSRPHVLTPLDLSLALRLRSAFGADGDAFVRSFRDRLDEARTRWGLDVGAPWSASYGFVAPARRSDVGTVDGADVVLKLRVPNDDARAEVAALRCYDGRGAVRLLDATHDGGALLLQRASPGTDLRDLDDALATRIAAGVAQRLQTIALPNPSYPFPTVEDWAAGFARSGLKFDAIRQAERFFKELCATSAQPVLLHGDLHHSNIVADGEDWLAIDPQGVLGEPLLELTAFMRNPYPVPAAPHAVEERTARRLEILSAEWGLDAERLHAWTYAQTVLSACWVAEDGGDPRSELELAERIGRP